MPMNSVVNAFVSGTILFSMAGGPFLIIFGFPALLWRFAYMTPTVRFGISLSCFAIGLGYRYLERQLPPPTPGDGGFHGLLGMWQYASYIGGGVLTAASLIYGAIEGFRSLD
jgi:hypothetical protein